MGSQQRGKHLMRDFHIPGRSAVYASNGMVATSHPLAAQEALNVLRTGGSAVDAAICGAVLLGLCEPHMTGIGGDMFALVQPRPGAPVHALNGSGRAPRGLTAAALRSAGHSAVPPQSVAAITVPGAVDGFCALHARFGRLSLSHLLAPAIHYATEGVPVAPRVAFDWAESVHTLQGHAKDIFSHQGSAPPIGTHFRAMGQVQALKAIAAKGRAGFYEGAVAEDMVGSLRALGGTHTLDDFATTKATWHDPIAAPYKGFEVLEHPANGQGATALLMLNMLSQFDLTALDPFGAQRAHIEAEITKIAYDARNHLIADMDYATRVDMMLDQRYAKALSARIDTNPRPARADVGRRRGAP